MPKIKAFYLWIIFAALVSILKFNTEPTVGNVFNIYREAGLNWINSNSIYESGRFLYLPFSAVFFSPLAYIKFKYAGVIWRFLNIFIFAFGIYCISRDTENGKTEHKQTEWKFLVVSIISILLSWATAKHGQATLLMAGLMLIACTSLVNKKFILAGFCLSLAIIIKPLSIVLALLAIALYPRVIISCIVAGILLIAVSFLTQDTSFILEQLNQYPLTVSYTHLTLPTKA